MARPALARRPRSRRRSHARCRERGGVPQLRIDDRRRAVLLGIERRRRPSRRWLERRQSSPAPGNAVKYYALRPEDRAHQIGRETYFSRGPNPPGAPMRISFSRAIVIACTLLAAGVAP